MKQKLGLVEFVPKILTVVSIFLLYTRKNLLHISDHSFKNFVEVGK